MTINASRYCGTDLLYSDIATNRCARSAIYVSMWSGLYQCSHNETFLFVQFNNLLAKLRWPLRKMKTYFIKYSTETRTSRDACSTCRCISERSNYLYISISASHPVSQYEYICYFYQNKSYKSTISLYGS